MRAAWLALAFLALVLVARSAIGATDAGRITVTHTATIAGRTVRLGDVAVLEGDARRFADLELGTAPEPGASRRIDGVTILRRLSDAGLDPRVTRYEIPASIRVERAVQEVRADELRAAVEHVAPGVLAPGESIRSLDVAGPVRIPVGPYEVQVSTPAASRRGGRRRFDVELLQGGEVVATVPVLGDIEAFGPVVTVRQPVARGALLRAEDLDVGERALTALQTNVVTDPEQAIGKQARVALAAGSLLSVAALESPVLVRRGDIVTAVVETPGMRLTVPGEALESGASGAGIRILNRASKQELLARVVDRGVVLVQY